MNRKKKTSAYLFIAAACAFSLYYAYSFFGTNYPNPESFSNIQDPNAIPTLTDDVNSCISNPTIDCDSEMLEIKKFCVDNKNKAIPVCSDPRVQQYIDQHGLERPTINTGK